MCISYSIYWEFTLKREGESLQKRGNMIKCLWRPVHLKNSTRNYFRKIWKHHSVLSNHSDFSGGKGHDTGMTTVSWETLRTYPPLQNTYITQKLVKGGCKGTEKYRSILDIPNGTFGRGLRGTLGIFWMTRSPRKGSIRLSRCGLKGPVPSVDHLPPVWLAPSWGSKSSTRARQSLSWCYSSCRQKLKSFLWFNPPMS